MRVLLPIATLALALGLAHAGSAEAQVTLPRCSDDEVVQAVVNVLAQHATDADKPAADAPKNITQISETPASRICNATVKASVSRDGSVHFGGSEETTIEYKIVPSEKHGRFSGYVVSVNLAE